jgi:hypothetical protein
MDILSYDLNLEVEIWYFSIYMSHIQCNLQPFSVGNVLDPNDNWNGSTIEIIDFPECQGDVVDRTNYAIHLLPSQAGIYFRRFWKIYDVSDVLRWRRDSIDLGSQLIAKGSHVGYFNGRHPSLMKVKAQSPKQPFANKLTMRLGETDRNWDGIGTPLRKESN